MDFLISIISLFTVLLPVVIIHELGHMIIGKILGAEPRTFAFGFGKTLFSIKKWDIDFQFNILPIGGFVDFKTTQFPELEPSKKPFKSWKWIPIALAGPISNFIFSFFIFIIFYFSLLNSINVTKNVSYDNRDNLKVVELSGSSLFYKSVFMKDKSNIVKYNNEYFFDLKKINPNDIKMNNTIPESKNFFKLLQVSSENSASIMYKYITLNINFIMNIFNSKDSSKDLSGPIGIANAAKEGFKEGFIQMLYFIGIISTALGFFNLLPFFIILDGGRAMIAVWESTFKPIPISIIKNFNTISLGFFLFLFIFTTYNDISKLIGQ